MPFQRRLVDAVFRDVSSDASQMPSFRDVSSMPFRDVSSVFRDVLSMPSLETSRQMRF